MNKIMKSLRCWLGIHNIPKNWAYEEGAALYVGGGICPDCREWKSGRPWPLNGEGITYAPENLDLLQKTGYEFKGSAFCGMLTPFKNLAEELKKEQGTYLRGRNHKKQDA